MRFPEEWLRNWIPTPQSLAGLPLRAASGWSAALSAALAALESDEELALPQATVAEQIAALLALAAGPSVQARRASDQLLERVRRRIRDRFHESGLSPGMVADDFGVCKRYLHSLFANAGTTFNKELMRVRLDAAHRMLSDRRYEPLSIGEVSARCGFVEPSHFARRFRQAFGHGPSDFRAVSLNATQPLRGTTVTNSARTR